MFRGRVLTPRAQAVRGALPTATARRGRHRQRQQARVFASKSPTRDAAGSSVGQEAGSDAAADFVEVTLAPEESLLQVEEVAIGGHTVTLSLVESKAQGTRVVVSSDHPGKLVVDEDRRSRGAVSIPPPAPAPAPVVAREEPKPAPKPEPRREEKAKRDRAAAPAPAPIPDLPGELCGIWAYIMWEEAGCPQRSDQEADLEYQRGISELKGFLRSGYTLDDLWKVANGEVKLRDFYRSAASSAAPAPAARAEAKAAPAREQPSPPPTRAPVSIPEELLGVQAYILWEEAGCPDGADFGDKARELIRDKVERLGWTLDQVERDLKEPKQKEPAAKQQEKQQQQQPPQPPPQPPSPPPIPSAMTHDPLKWVNDTGSGQAALVAGGLDASIVSKIVDLENKSSWTLMHRFNSCAEAIQSGDDLRYVYVWLRFSALRQLTWQRHYNTQPRHLTGAQENLTSTLARQFARAKDPIEAQYVRMCLANVGKGGNGQRIRDDILHIMHRHKVKEVKGTWMEEWHQKLHNNTTPDDIHICEAYIAFLENGGSNHHYWDVLGKAGVTRERLESLDRPIVQEPEDFPDKREGLIKDFYDYLGVLKSVHSGTDLQTAAAASQSVISQNGDLGSKLGYVLSQGGGGGDPVGFIQCAVDARCILEEMGALRQGDGNGAARDCLYLDAALESQIRACAEAAAGNQGLDVARLVSPLLQNLCLSTGDNAELCYCLQAWQGLPNTSTQGISKEEALLMSAVVDRMKRAVGDLIERANAELQPIANAVGPPTGCDDWAVELFTEEVVRGGPAFCVSLVISLLEPSLRTLAELGSWQIISPAPEKTLLAKNVYHAQELYACMKLSFASPCVLVCDRVTGEEDIPENCVAVVTRDSPDMLSHIAVRARNEKVLLATCHDEAEFERIKANEAAPVPTSAAGDAAGDGRNQWFALNSTGSGSLTYERCDAPGGQESGAAAATGVSRNVRISSPKWRGKYAVGMDGFKDEVVGAKSKNLAGLRDKLPGWIRLPESVTIPFGTFEHVLEKVGANSALKADIARLTSSDRVSEDPEEALEKAKALAMEVSIPSEMRAAVVEGMREAGIDWRFEGGSKARLRQEEQIEAAIKSVWASKFNLRAYYSLHKAKLNFMDVRMAVLIQKVVNAKYAFVIHTTNPSTGDAGEVYCEVVKGLGEVLVGNYPGRALSFTCDKRALAAASESGQEQAAGMIQIESFPSKSVGLYLPESLIFRSDSNGEDLEGYAGAGLYDSVPMHEPEARMVDYASDPIMQDAGFRNRLLAQIARVGYELEQVLGSPQDIEGCIDDDGNLYVVQTRPQM